MEITSAAVKIRVTVFSIISSSIFATNFLNNHEAVVKVHDASSESRDLDVDVDVQLLSSFRA